MLTVEPVDKEGDRGLVEERCIWSADGRRHRQQGLL